jgi:rhodanese-related sulfurtransferase
MLKRIFGIEALLQVFGLALCLAGPISIVIQSESSEAQEQVATEFTILESAQLAAMLQKKDFLLVNVHIPYEGEIRNTDVFIPFDKITENLDKLPKDKSAEIVLYCRSGRMSELAAKDLVRLGYRQVSHLSGGMNDWKQSGFEIIEK